MLDKKGFSTRQICESLCVGRSFVKKIKRVFRNEHSVEYKRREGKTPMMHGVLYYIYTNTIVIETVIRV